MGTKKGGARKGKPKGSRLAFDDTKRAGIVKMGGKKPKKSWGEARAKAESLKKTRGKVIPTQLRWDQAIKELTTGGFTPEQAIDILLRVTK